ncbi:hypothetical protein [Mesorhizobium sp. M0213]|uniref:hypothetical protein n=1 Tax=Mesorhizobium sp. M0213 TaxID=2956917 RepID=UPI00333D353B
MADDPRVIGIGLRLACSNSFRTEAPLVTVVVQEDHCRAHLLEGCGDARALHAARAAPLYVGEEFEPQGESNSFPVTFE